MEVTLSGAMKISFCPNLKENTFEFAGGIASLNAKYTSSVQ